MARSRFRLAMALLIAGASAPHAANASELRPEINSALDGAVVRIGVCEALPNVLLLTPEQRGALAVSLAERELAETGRAGDPAAIAARMDAFIAELPDQVALCGTLNSADWRNAQELFVLSSTGTGFVVDTDGHVVTNEHVVANPAHVVHTHVVVFDGSAITPVVRTAEVRWTSRVYDLAILRVANLDSARSPLAVANPERTGLQRADRVWKAGFPGGSDFGIASSYRATDGKGFNLRAIVDPGTVRAPLGTSVFLGDQSVVPARVIEHNAPINPGDSGGPLIDACGRVVAINEHKIIAQTVDSTYRSVDTTHLIDGLRELGIPFQLDNRVCATTGPDGPAPVDPIPLSMPVAASAEPTSATASAPASGAMQPTATLALAGAVIAGLALLAFVLLRNNQRLRGSTHAREVAPARGEARPAGVRTDFSTCGVLVGTGKLAGRTWRLDGAGELRVGRRDAALELADDVISGEHARISWDSAQQRVWIEDAHSLNGTWRGDRERLPAGTRVQMLPGQRYYFAEREFGVLLEAAHDSTH